MPLYDYQCDQCEARVERAEVYPAPEWHPCQAEGCSGVMKKSFPLVGGYVWNCDSGGSTKPKATVKGNS